MRANLAGNSDQPEFTVRVSSGLEAVHMTLPNWQAECDVQKGKEIKCEEEAQVGRHSNGVGCGQKAHWGEVGESEVRPLSPTFL
jgi:hypothetical protein